MNNLNDTPSSSNPLFDPQCLICRKHRGKFPLPGGAIHMDDLVFVCHAHIPEFQSDQYLGWIVLETRRHTPDLASLSEAEAMRIGDLARQLARLLVNHLEAEKVYAFIIGDGVAHFHLHLIPRYPGTPREFWGTRIDEWPDAPRGTESEIAQLCARLREGFATEV